MMQTTNLAAYRNTKPTAARRVLIVDDDPDVLESLEDLLELSGFLTRTAANSIQAEQAAAAFDPHIALLDVKLGATSGLDLVPTLKRRVPGIVCIMMTAYASTDSVIQALRSAPDDYIRKPVAPTDLIKILGRSFDSQQLESQRLAADRVLRDNEHRLRAIMRNVADGLVTIGADNRIETFNPAAAHLFGYDPENIIGKNAAVLLDRTGDGRQQGRFRTYLDTGAGGAPGTGTSEVTARRNDGSTFTMEIKVGEVLLEGGPVLICTLRDISERQAIQRALVQAKEEAELGKRTMREFLANMSHELRTPLNSIIGFAQFMEQGLFGELGNERYRGYAGDIHQSARHLLDIINDILDLSKLEAGEHTLNEEAFAVAPVIDGCVQFLRSRADAQKIEITSHVAGSVHQLYADQRNVKQILINLLSNAVKFTPAGGKVSVTAAADDTGLVISIADTGIGMAAEDIVVALAPFRQLDSDLDRRFEGTGLGLPLVRSLIEAHGGTLEIGSAPGAGTTAVVRFPSDRLRVSGSVE